MPAQKRQPDQIGTVAMQNHIGVAATAEASVGSPGRTRG